MGITYSNKGCSLFSGVWQRCLKVWFPLLMASILSACHENHTETIDTPAQETPVPEIELAVAPVLDSCSENILCNYAAETANLFAEYPDNTCYVFESTLNEDLDRKPHIDLAATPKAFVSMSGWIHHALTSQQEWAQVATEIDAYKEESTPWARTHVMQKYFTKLANGSLLSDMLSASNDLNQLAPGDVMTWCEGKWCSASGPSYGDTGYAAIVLKVDAISIEEIDAARYSVPFDADFFRVAVVSAAHQVHGSDFSESSVITDLRHQGGELKSELCDHNGGLGAASIVLAQWLGEQNQYRWSYVLYNEANHHFFDIEQQGEMNLAFARLKSE